VEVLITGGNGLLGRYLVPVLLERGDRVRVLALPEEDTSWLEARDVEVHRGDVRSPQTLVPPMRGVEGVLHLAAMMGVWRPLHDYHAVNVTGTANVCRAALAAGVRRLVHVSSWTVYGLNLGRVATEDLPLEPMAEPYGATKAEADAEVQRLIADEGLPAAIVRPGTFFGPGDRLHFGRIADRIRTGRWITIGSGRNALPFVYVADVAQGLLLALDRDEALGQVYNITNDQPLTQEETWRAIADAIGARPPRLRVPYRPLLAAGYAAEQVTKVARVRRQPPVTRLGVMLFGGDNRHSIDKARRELGYVPTVPLGEGIRLAAEWYRKHGAASAPVAA
jgi:nucleoside-diphosphate-sugar epimerase